MSFCKICTFTYVFVFVGLKTEKKKELNVSSKFNEHHSVQADDVNCRIDQYLPCWEQKKCVYFWDFLYANTEFYY